MEITSDLFYDSSPSIFKDKCTICFRSMTPVNTAICNRCAEMRNKVLDIYNGRWNSEHSLQIMTMGELGVEEFTINWVLMGMNGELQKGINLKFGIDKSIVEDYLGAIIHEIQHRNGEKHSHEEGKPGISGVAR